MISKNNDRVRKKYILFIIHMKKTLFFLGAALLFSGCGNTPDSPQISEKTPQTNEGKLAKCLAEKGAVVYGTEWCPHCKTQKKMFGSESKEFLNFIDCDKKAGLCQRKGITGYPTWKFSDGSELGGARQLEELAKKSGCEYSKK